MNSLTTTVSICPAIKDYSAALASDLIFSPFPFDSLKQLFSPVKLLCILFFLSASINIILCIIEFKQFISSIKKSVVYSPKNFDSSNSIDQENYMKKIKQRKQNKRSSIDLSVDDSESIIKVKSPKLMSDELFIIETKRNGLSHRSSWPESPFTTIKINSQLRKYKAPLSTNHERITLVEDEDLETDNNNSCLSIDFNHNRINQRDTQKF